MPESNFLRVLIFRLSVQKVDANVPFLSVTLLTAVEPCNVILFYNGTSLVIRLLPLCLVVDEFAADLILTQDH
jgi:hypothetical protein